jgi:hypothetical protein
MQYKARFGHWQCGLLLAVSVVIMVMVSGVVLAQQITPLRSTPVGALEGAPADGGLFGAGNNAADSATAEDDLFGAIDADVLATAALVVTESVTPTLESEFILGVTPLALGDSANIVAPNVTPLPLTSDTNNAALPPVLPVDMAVGDVVTGSLEGDQPARSYSFVAPSNGLLLIQLDTDFLMTTNFASFYEEPSGGGSGSGGGTWAAAEDELLVLTARAGEEFQYSFVSSDGETGDYSLTVRMLDAADMLPLAYGETVTGELTPAQPFAVYMFNGAAGDTVALSADTLSGVAMSVQTLPVSGDGSDAAPQYPVMLPVPPDEVIANNVNRMVLRNDGVYGIVVQVMRPLDEIGSEFSLSLGQVTGGLDDLPQYVRLLPDDRVRVLTFMGTANETVTLSARLLGLEADVAITVRQGEAVLASFNTGDSVFPTEEMTQQFTIPADGTVEVMVMGETFPQVSPESLSVIEVQLVLTR